jgi:hypothetical protein
MKVAEKQTYSYPLVAGNRLFMKDQDSLTLWTIDWGFHHRQGAYPFEARLKVLRVRNRSRLTGLFAGAVLSGCRSW